MARLSRRTIRRVECNQPSFLSGGCPIWAGALLQQDRMTSDLAAIRRAGPNVTIGYYGIDPVPPQFSAGRSVSTWHQVTWLELNHSYQQWREFGEGRGQILV